MIEHEGDSEARKGLDAIRAIARTRKSDVGALCAELQRIAAHSTASDRAAIYVVDHDARALVMLAAPFGYDGELATRYRQLPLDAPVIGNVLRSLSPAVFSASDLPERYRESSIDAGFVEYAIVPLHAEGVLSGSLNLARTHATPYTAEEVRLALTLGDQISVQIERARLYMEKKERASTIERLDDDLRRSNERLARTQEELHQKDRLVSLGELAVVVAHEVRNPLGVILNVVTQLRRVLPPEPNSASELLHILDEEASQLGRIVRSFLEYGRPSAPKPRQIDLALLLESAQELATHATSNTSLEWRIHVDPLTRAIEADEHLLCQALTGLFVNAAQAQGPGGTITVQAAPRKLEDRDHVSITVEDEGETPQQEVLDRAFEPFFSTKASGIGLGMAIAKRTIEAHGGQIAIAAREDRRGTIVSMLLPMRAEDSP